ncbi:MAG TPA: DNA starvation/stationary phase protection protein, partial [Halieaceae bacterium]|nr:DNA starvation/stationary phase protection protein [Halieaceae bacterium]
MNKIANFTAPGIEDATAEKTIGILDNRMVALIDLALTLKHVHWNVVGPNFIGVHEMLDPQVEAVREMVDQVAERIATLGGEPVGTP